MIKKGAILLTSIICMTLLASCNRGTVTTVDRSVDYHSAQSLPSLKKEPAGDIASTSPHINNKVKPENITASIITKKGVQRLSINAKPVAAWDYMDAALQKAGITIYSRRYEAGMFFIGCGDNGEISKEKKSRSWGILKRKKTTVVTFVDREGEVVNNSYTADLYKRILNH